MQYQKQNMVLDRVCAVRLSRNAAAAQAAHGRGERKRESPRLCRGGTHCLTFPGVDRRNSLP